MRIRPPGGTPPALLIAAAAILAAGAAAPSRLSARQYSPDRPQTVTIAPDTQYRAGWLHRLLFGGHWRDLWSTPVEVEVLDLGEFAGGLRPVRRGGGFQTKSLRLRGADGREYKFRSIAKDPTAVLPPELRRSVAAAILQDQISSSNPMAAVVVAPLLDAAGVLNARPQAVWLPSTSALGEFREEFGGLLGTIEENPDDPDESISAAAGGSFADADKFRGTVRLLEELAEDDDEVVDAVEFLKARLMDVFVGDWDRHIDQWRWAGYREGGIRRWVPIPRDRDQAFARFDGLFPWIASIAVPQLEGFGDDLPEIEDLTWSGRFLDRRLLAGAERTTWDSVAAFLVGRLTDRVIRDAVRRLPEPMYELEGEYLVRTLRIRRDRLPGAAAEFYRLLAEYPEIHLTDRRERVEVTYPGPGLVRVEVFGRRGGDPRFRRTFRDDETHEIRIHLRGGDDVVRISGTRQTSMGLVVSAGSGDDELIDESTGGGIADVPPFSLFSSPAVALYDEDPRTPRPAGRRLKFVTSPAPAPATRLEEYEPRLRDYGYDWKFAPWYGVTPGEGLFLGGGPILYKHGFRADPFVYRMQLRGGVASGPGRIRIDFTGDFRAIAPPARLTALAELSQIEILNYFGRGNATRLDDSLLESGFYRARSRHLLVAPAVVVPFGGRSGLLAGAALKGFDPDPASGTVLAAQAPPGSGDPGWYGSLRLEARYDTRDIPAAASRGIFALLRLSSHHPLGAGLGQFRKAALEARTYLTLPDAPATLALRAGAQKVWGGYPWYEAAFLGGPGSGPDASFLPGSGPSTASASPLRGYARQRFAGDAAAYAGAEARIGLASFLFLVPMRFGVSAGAETGRVFVRGESSRAWHASAGGGIWFTFVDAANVLGVSVHRSPERTGFYLSGGFGF